MAHPWRGRLLAVAKLVFVVAAVAYLVQYARVAFAEHAHEAWFTPSNGWRVGLAALAFAATTLFSILGWRWLLARMAYEAPLRQVAGVFSITQIAKYLPGNVGHHIGRVALARSTLGVPMPAAVVSLMQESALVALAAASVGLACYAIATPPPIGPGALQVDVRLLSAGLVAGGLLACLLVPALRTRWPEDRWPVVRRLLSAVPDLATAAGALVRYLPIYLLNGVAVAIIASGFTPLGVRDVAMLTAAYSLSWLVGFLLPGAPGGVGVREAAFLMLLGGTYPPGVALALTVLARLASVLADVLVFCAGLAVRRHPRSNPIA